MANEVVARYLNGKVVKGGEPGPVWGPFFFVLPADTRSNNVRVLVNKTAVKRMGQPPAPAA